MVIDRVQQNLGAAVRVAYFLGVAGVLCCARNSAPLSPAVSKASAGALEWLPLHACRSMPRTLSRAAECGWHVVGGSALQHLFLSSVLQLSQYRRMQLAAASPSSHWVIQSNLHCNFHSAREAAEPLSLL